MTTTFYCEHLVQKRFEIRPNLSALVTPFRYPNSQSIVIFEETYRDGRIVLSDNGHTLAYLDQHDVSLTDERLTSIRRICRSTGSEREGNHLRVLTTIERAPGDLPRVVQASAEVAALRHAAPDANVASSYPLRVGRALDFIARDKFEVRRQWRSSKDEEGAFLVDFHVSGPRDSRNVFVLSNRERVSRIGLAAFYLRQLTNTPSMVVVDPSFVLGRRPLARLQHTVDEIAFGLALPRERDKFRDFVSAVAA